MALSDDHAAHALHTCWFGALMDRLLSGTFDDLVDTGVATITEDGHTLTITRQKQTGRLTFTLE